VLYLRRELNNVRILFVPPCISSIVPSAFKKEKKHETKLEEFLQSEHT